MILPTKAKETEAYIYIVKEDAAAIKANPDFEEIQGLQSELHGNVIGYVNGKIVIIVREL